MSANVILFGAVINIVLSLIGFAATGRLNPLFGVPATVLLWIGIAIKWKEIP